MTSSDSRISDILDKSYPHKEGKIFAIERGVSEGVNEEMGSGINTVKSFLKRHSRLYEFLRTFFSPGMSIIPHLTPRKAVLRTFSEAELADKIIVNVGAGVKPVHDEIINLDVFPYENTHIVAEGSRLPFRAGTVDMIICESVLEHTTDPFAVIAEIKRVLRPGGRAYVSLPFMYPFHASPNDFTRFSRVMLRRSFDDFTVLEEGLRAGPMAALQGLLMHLFAIPLSFGSYNLHLILANIFMVLLAPLKLLDPLFAPFPYSHEVAADIYILVEKP